MTIVSELKGGESLFKENNYRLTIQWGRIIWRYSLHLKNSLFTFQLETFNSSPMIIKHYTKIDEASSTLV